MDEAALGSDPTARSQPACLLRELHGSSPARNCEKIRDRPEQIPLYRIPDIGRNTARGRFPVGELVAMRRPTRLDRTTQFPLTLAGGLRTTFADVVSSPTAGSGGGARE